jgi:hypothetical protein
MKNYWLDKKAARSEAIEIPVPPMIPMIDIGPINIPDLQVNFPPIIFGTIDISDYQIPTEIKLEGCGIPTEIRMMTPDFIPGSYIQMDQIIPPTAIMIDWGTPPVIDCIITIHGPTC